LALNTNALADKLLREASSQIYFEEGLIPQDIKDQLSAQIDTIRNNNFEGLSSSFYNII